MDLTVEEVTEGLFSDEAYATPCDKGKPEQLEMKLPEWFDEKKYNQGRRFQNDFYFSHSVSMMIGLLAVLSIPTILNVLVGTRRSNSQYTAFKRYMATYLHIMAWFNHDLKPGSKSWRSLHYVRSSHLKADRAAKTKGKGTVSQRDVAFTQFGFVGFTVLKPDKLCIRQLQPGDWDSFCHFWAVIGHMIGLEDRYNICRLNFEDTRQVCQIILDRVYTPCLTFTPDYFEHAAHVMTVGMSNIHLAVQHESLVYTTKYFANVPGYVYTEEDRQKFQAKLKAQLKGRTDAGVDASALIEKCAVNILPKSEPMILYPEDYETVESSPTYKKLPFSAKFKISLFDVFLGIYSTYIGRYLLNLHFYWCVLLGTYLPYIAMWKYGIRQAYVNMFKETPVDDEQPKSNSYYYNMEPKPWYREVLDMFVGQSE